MLRFLIILYAVSKSMRLLIGPVGTIPGFEKLMCLTGFGMDNDFGFVPVKQVLFVVDVTDDQRLCV